jgi:Lon protease-like protein
MLMNTETVPLFPLNTVLFPGGLLPLRIFEPRYLDMVSWCLRHDKAFGVCLIRHGSEVGEAADTYSIGTLAKIIDWNKRDDGMLGIMAEGQQRFRILQHGTRSNQLLEGEVSLIPADRDESLPNRLSGLNDLLKQAFKQLGKPYTSMPFQADKAAWIGNRLAELLPMGNQQRQHLLELEDPQERLLCLEEILHSLEVRH